MLSLKENMLRVYRHQEPEYTPLFSDFNSAMLGGMDFINERPEIPGVNLDWFGQSWTWEEKTHAANPTPGKPLLTDITQWREVVKFPDLDAIDWETHAAKDTANWDRENKLSRVTVGFGLWERLFSIMPFEDALCALLEEPEACYEFFGAIADYKIRLHDLVIKHYKPDVLVMHDDYGDGRALFMPPETWRQLIKPHLKRVVDAVQSKGVIYEHHNCGCFAPIVEEALFRGLFFAPLYRKVPILAYVVSTVLFSAIHVVGAIGTLDALSILLCFIQYLPAGIALGFVYQRTGNIIGPMLLHFMINFLASAASFGL